MKKESISIAKESTNHIVLTNSFDMLDNRTKGYLLQNVMEIPRYIWVELSEPE